MKNLQRGAVLLTASLIVGLPLLGAGSAQAAPAPTAATAGTAATALPCVTDTARQLQGPDVPVWRRHDDTAPVTQRDLDALPPKETKRSYVAREVAPVLPSIVTIPTYVHVIKGRHKGERNPAGRQKVRRVIATLNNAMAGRQSSFSAPARYRFALRKIDYTTNEGWYHAYFYGPRDQKAKRKLHRGNAGTLNLYINDGGPKGGPVLGWSRFPWMYASSPKLDGVSVNVAGLPGGRARGYNLGDTVVHETGHWLGLFHTFQGGCGRVGAGTTTGDLVADTPAEAEPSFYCQTTRDTCTSDPGLDPVHNFMDYSLDACMNMFTVGQVQRMDAAFAKWRL